MSEVGYYRYKTIAVDLDFGCPNLYTFLGLNNNFPGIGDYLLTKYSNLEQLLVDTSFTNLSYLPGDVQSPFMANITFAEKMKLIRNIKKLPADFILLDLGAGCSFNTLDLFGVVQKGLIITTTEVTSVMNMFNFLKNFLLRTIDRALPVKIKLRQFIRNIYTQTSNKKRMTISDLYDELSHVDSSYKSILNNIFKSYRPRLIFNRGHNPEELYKLELIDKNISENLLIEVDHFGYILEDEKVIKSSQKKLPYLSNYPDTNFSSDITRIADRVTRLWDQELKNSAEILIKKTKSIYSSLVEIQT